MEKNLYLEILKCLDDLEISLDSGEWLYIKNDLKSLRESLKNFNKIKPSTFFQYKFNEIVSNIVFTETEAILFLKKNNIIG
jgi:hypothetical protein